MSDPTKQPLSGATMIAVDGESAGIPVAVQHPTSGRVFGGMTSELEGSILADRYRILRKLGEGGMGSVYLAEHTTINKKLAIKILSSEYNHKQDLVDRFPSTRFVASGSAGAALKRKSTE